MRLGTLLAVGCGVLLAAATSARAEDEPGVARVSLIEGNASYLRGDADDWTGVDVNAPLVTGDRFFAAADSRAEIQLDPAVYARISSETEVSMLELGPDTTQVRMSLGLATFRVRRDPGKRHVEIDTPGAAVVVREAGVYRVSVDRSGDTNLQVRDGEATIYVAGEQYQIGDGRGVSIEGIGDAARPRIYSAAGSDGWDEWESQRARRIENAASYRYVSEDIYGAEDLDEYGDWQYESEYGNVWRPRVAAGWAPYTDGRWVWVDPWGWTWMDYSAWGWAPFHYGRWVYANNYWGWAPGPIIASPVYAPALVGWFGGGWGGGVSVSVGVGFGFGAIGWTPLGWGEPCFPWWGGWGGVAIGRPWWGGWGGPRIYNNVVINKNITNVNINNYNFGNLRRPGGLSSVPVRDFQSGRGRVTPVGGERLQDFRAIGGRVPVTPTRDSLPAANPTRASLGRGLQPPSEIDGRRVVSARTPTANGQPSFDRKLPVLERSQGEPLTPARLREMGAESGRTPPVQSIANRGEGGRQLRTPPAAGSRGETAVPGQEAARGRDLRTSPIDRSGASSELARRGEPSVNGGGSVARAGSNRAGVERSGSRRETVTLPGARTPQSGADRMGAAGSGSRGRSVARPPAGVERGGGALPAAPRAAGANRQPYVARRPDSGGPASGARSQSSRSIGGVRSGAPDGGTRGGAPSRSIYPSNGNPVARSVDPGGKPQTRSIPGAATGREMQSAPRMRSAPQGSPRSGVRSAPAPERAGSRSYFSQPRSATAPRSSSAYPSAPSYSRPGTRGAPTARSAPSSQMGAARAPQRSFAGSQPSRSSPMPQARSAPPQMGGSAMSRGGAPSGGFAAQRSAPSGARGFSSGAPGGTMSRFGGGGGTMSRSGGGGAMMSRSGGGGMSGGGRSLGGGRSGG